MTNQTTNDLQHNHLRGITRPSVSIRRKQSPRAVLNTCISCASPFSAEPAVLLRRPCVTKVRSHETLVSSSFRCTDMFARLHKTTYDYELSTESISRDLQSKHATSLRTTNFTAHRLLIQNVLCFIASMQASNPMPYIDKIVQLLLSQRLCDVYNTWVNPLTCLECLCNMPSDASPDSQTVNDPCSATSYVNLAPGGH